MDCNLKAELANFSVQLLLAILEKLPKTEILERPLSTRTITFYWKNFSVVYLISPSVSLLVYHCRQLEQNYFAQRMMDSALKSLSSRWPN